MVFAHAVEFGEFREKGLIAPGEYRLAVEMLAATGNNVPGSIVRTEGEFAFTFDLTPVSAQTPEPASLVLLGSGLLGLVRIPRSRPLWTDLPPVLDCIRRRGLTRARRGSTEF
jgi:hypothetical protein